MIAVRSPADGTVACSRGTRSPYTRSTSTHAQYAANVATDAASDASDTSGAANAATRRCTPPDASAYRGASPRTATWYGTANAAAATAAGNGDGTNANARASASHGTSHQLYRCHTRRPATSERPPPGIPGDLGDPSVATVDQEATIFDHSRDKMTPHTKCRKQEVFHSLTLVRSDSGKAQRIRWPDDLGPRTEIEVRKVV